MYFTEFLYRGITSGKYNYAAYAGIYTVHKNPDAWLTDGPASQTDTIRYLLHSVFNIIIIIIICMYKYAKGTRVIYYSTYIIINGMALWRLQNIRNVKIRKQTRSFDWIASVHYYYYLLLQSTRSHYIIIIIKIIRVLTTSECINGTQAPSLLRWRPSGIIIASVVVVVVVFASSTVYTRLRERPYPSVLYILYYYYC